MWKPGHHPTLFLILTLSRCKVEHTLWSGVYVSTVNVNENVQGALLGQKNTLKTYRHDSATHNYFDIRSISVYPKSFGKLELSHPDVAHYNEAEMLGNSGLQWQETQVETPGQLQAARPSSRK